MRVLNLFIFYFFFSFGIFSSNYEIILKRNIFKPLQGKETEKKIRIEPITIIPQPEKIDKFYKLLGTVVFDKKEESFGIFQDLKSSEIVNFHIGDEVVNYKIIDIKNEGVVFQNIIGEKFLLTNDLLKQIDKTSNTYFYKVNLKETIEILKEDSELLNSLKSQFFKNGNITGYKIKGIKEGSIIEKAGIIEDDVIIKINDEEVKNPEIFLNVFENILKNKEKKVFLKIFRGDKFLNIVYFIE